jgi:hypothetical protein
MNQDLSKWKQAADLRRGDKPVFLHTGEFIVAAEGKFLSNRNTPVGRSRNAAVGRLLSKHAQELGISHLKAHMRVVDSDGRKTHAALWRIDPY